MRYIYLSLLAVLTLGIYTFGQVPAFVNVSEIDSPDTIVKLGSKITWPSTPGAEWDLYTFEDVGVYGVCQNNPVHGWTQVNSAPIVDNPNGNVYNAFLVPQPQFNYNLPYEGAGGIWCFAVARTVNGVDGPMTVSPIRNLLGQYLYLRLCVQSPPYVTCDSHTGGQSLFVQSTWNVSRNGVPMPIKDHHDTAAGYQYTSVFRVLSTDTVTASVRLDTLDGKVLQLPEILGPQKNPDVRRNYVQFVNVTVDKATEGIVHITHFERFRIASGGN